MKKFISMAVVVVMVLAMAMVSSADLVSEIKIVGTTTAPVIDGNVTIEEWGEPVYTVTGSERKQLQDAATEPYTIYAGAEGQEVLAAQTTGKSYLRWDATNLYLAYVVSYPYHISDQTEGSIWQDSMVQSTIVPVWPAPEGDTNADLMYELGYDLDNDLKTIKTWAWYPAELAGEIPGAQVVITRKGTETNYEISIPWTTFKIDPATVKEGLQVGISSAYNFKDENGATLQYQVGGSLFGKIASNSIPATLVAAPAAETPEEETPAEETPEEETPEETPDEENPETADASAVMYALAVLSTLGGSIVIGKRK